MNRELLIKQLKELIIFFEKQPKQTVALSVREHIILLKSMWYLLDKCPDTIDFSGYSVDNRNKRSELMSEIEKRIKQLKMPECVEYADIAGRLKLFHFCLSLEINYEINSEKWLELAGSTRALEMERLWLNVKK